MTMKLKFNNAWLSLYAKSMGKLLEITHITTNQDQQDKLFREHDVIAVSALPGDENVVLLSDVNCISIRANSLMDLSSPEGTFSNLYIKALGKYFQVAYVTTGVEECNRICFERPDIALMAIDNVGRHYLVSIQAARLKEVAA